MFFQTFQTDPMMMGQMAANGSRVAAPQYVPNPNVMPIANRSRKASRAPSLIYNEMMPGMPSEVRMTRQRSGLGQLASFGGQSAIATSAF